MPLTTRTYTMKELLWELETSVKKEGRTVCPVTDWVRAHQTDGTTVDQFEAWVTSHPDYAAPTCIDMILKTGYYNTPETTEEVQTLYANYLLSIPWKKVRPVLEQLFTKDRQMPTTPSRLELVTDVCPSAMTKIVGLLRENHPNPRAFFLQGQGVRRSKVHISVDMSQLKCPSWPILEVIPCVGTMTDATMMLNPPGAVHHVKAPLAKAV